MISAVSSQIFNQPRPQQGWLGTNNTCKETSSGPSTPQHIGKVHAFSVCVFCSHVHSAHGLMSLVYSDYSVEYWK